ncbi:MAG: hypothetical protein KDD44_07910 [Bdellovibrionales bacterium]|nr:hypothetical protein [Bdellovibrionales bacterium]
MTWTGVGPRRSGLSTSLAAAAPIEPLQWWDEGVRQGFDRSTIVFALLIVAGLLLMTVAAVLGKMVSEKRRRRAWLKKQLGTLDELLRENERRLQLLDVHAMDYLSALSPDATRKLTLAKDIIHALQQLRLRLERLYASDELPALIAAEELVSKPLSMKRDMTTSLYGSKELPALFHNQWAPTLDECFQVVGAEITAASQSASLLSFSKKDRGTIADLHAAGIRYLNEQGRRLTQTFRRTFRRDEGEDR